MTTTLAPTAATTPPRTHAELAAAVVYRDSDHSYRYATPCAPCVGAGEVPGARAGTTKKCPKCKGAGETTTRVPSVTTILAELNKPALVPWAARVGADAAVEFLADWMEPADNGGRAAFVPESRLDEIHELVRNAHQKTKDESAATGTTVHDWIEQHHGDILGAPDPDDPTAVAPWRAFVAWWRTAGFEVVATERMCIDKKGRYAGRFDLLLRDQRGELWIGDIKTSNSVYAEHVLQCAAYASAIRDETETMVAGTIVIWCHKDGRPVETVVRTRREYRADFRVYAALLGIYEHRKVLGPTLRQLAKDSNAAAEAAALVANDYPF